MSTRSNYSYLFSSLRDPGSLIRRRNLGEPSSLFEFEEVMNNNHNQEPPPQNDPSPMVRPNEYDRLPRNSIYSFNDMMRKFLSKYFPPSMVTKLRNAIMKFEQKPHESLFEAWKRYKLSIYRCPNHNMLLVTQIDTFYNGLTLSHRDTINAASGETFMQKTPEECYELIENMTAHHNHWDTSAIRDETSRNISSTSTTESLEVVRQLEMMNKNFSEMMTQFQMVKAVDTKCETCGGPQSFTEYPAVGGYTQETAYATTGNSNSRDLKAITTRSGVTLAGPSVSPPPPSKEPSLASTSFFTFSTPKMPEVTKDTVQPKVVDLSMTSVNENCSAVTLKKLPEKIRDPDKFLIPCDFPEFDECLALADLDASINLMPLSIWKKLSLPELTFTQMILELADRSTTRPAGIAEDVFVKVGKFYFSTDFVVVDYVVDPQLTLRVDDEAITFKVGQTSKYSYNDAESINQIDVIDVACEEYAQEVLGFSNKSKSGSPTPTSDPIISSSSPSFTPFEGRDILYLEKLLNEDPSPNLPPVKTEDLKQVDATMTKPSIDEPSDLELKELSSHLEYAFLEGTDKLPVIISKELKDEEKSAFLKVLKSHKRAIAWKISDIKGIDPRFCTHKILIEDDFKPVVSPIHCVPKKGGMTVVENEDNELIPTRLVTGWRVCIDYRKLNDVTRKDHFPLPFMDQMLERLAGNELYCFLDGFFGYFQIPIDPQYQEKTTFTCLYETFAYRRMPFGLCNAPATFQRCMMAIFHDMIEKTIEVFMDDFSVFSDSFSLCLSHLDKMLQRCEDTNLVLNWEKCHFMVKEVIVLGHKISKSGIKVDRAKVDVIAKLPIRLSSKMLSRDCSGGFSSFKNLMLLFVIKKGAKKLAANHLSRLENPHQDELEKKEIPETFPLETLVMLIYGVTHRLSTAYQPQTSGQVKVSNRGLKRILERTIGENHASWSDKLDDALWAFCTAFKIHIGCTPYKLVYGKACHIPIELEHKAYWTLKHCNFDLKTTGDHRKVQLNELNELHNQAYDNSLIYKEKTKKIRDSIIKNRIFNVGDRVLLFNSRLNIFSGKLKTRWTRPFTVAQVFSYGTIELSQANGPNFKVNGHIIKHYFRGDIPQLVVLDLQTFPIDQ
uniref:Reverse transcriptase domain-containing protein n=1 Tax=Tanacetum cinerariifolium TaxID=118510 RepID=A0A6L2LGU8_TANCI|nr:reverse transcriptase domain-containing protein [Tanacetum cinerariifolium]